MATDDFFRAKLDQMTDMQHPLAALANRMPWAQIKAPPLLPAFTRKNRSGQVAADSDLFGTSLQIAGAGIRAASRPRLPIRLMASLLYLKHASTLATKNWWCAGPRTSCGSTSAATQIGRFRAAIGGAGVEELLTATIETAVQIKAVRPAEFERIIVDTTMQEKAIAHPVGSRLLDMARAKAVQAAERAGC